MLQGYTKSLACSPFLDSFSLKVLQPLMATAGGMCALLTSCYIVLQKNQRRRESDGMSKLTLLWHIYLE